MNQLGFQVIKMDTDFARSLQLKPRPGVPCLQISTNQEFDDDMYICWFYDAISPVAYLYAGIAIVTIFALVLFPLWPSPMRVAAWYVSMTSVGLVCSFFGIAFIRLMLFIASYWVLSPGLWLFPNLFEDVGIIESFIPLWAWHGENTLKMHTAALKKRLSKKQKQAKAEKKRQEEEFLKANEDATMVLQTNIEAINARIKAIADERENKGDPMNPTELAQLGQQFFAEIFGSSLQEPEPEEKLSERTFVYEEDIPAPENLTFVTTV